MRGLKRLRRVDGKRGDLVAPLAGAWIETRLLDGVQKGWGVAPLAGAWIETSVGPYQWHSPAVAPLAGVWIETLRR